MNDRNARLLRVALPLVAVAAFALGLWHFLFLADACAPDGAVRSRPAWVWLYESGFHALQLFVVGVAPQELCTVPGRLASVLAPATAVGAAVALLGQRLVRSWRIVCLQLAPAHAIFLGGGATAASIALRMFGRGVPPRRHKIVCVDRSAGSALAAVIGELRAADAFDWRADALSGGALSDLNVAGAQQVWVLTGSDLCNLEIARRLLERRRSAHVAPAKPPWLRVSVRDPRLLRAHARLDPAAGGGSLMLFDMERIAARRLLLQHPPAIPRVTLAGEPERPLHVAVIGDDTLAESIVEQAIAHLVHGERPADCLRVTLIGEDASAARQRLERRFPVLDAQRRFDAPLAALLPIAVLAAHDCEPTQLLPDDWRRLQQQTPFAVVYATHAVDLHAVAAALRAATLRDLDAPLWPSARSPASARPIVACLRQGAGGEAAFLPGKRGAPALPAGLSLFRIYEDSLDPDDGYPGEKQDQRAMLINLLYARTPGDLAHLGHDERMALARSLWFDNDASGMPRTPEVFRWSSRRAADHVPVKLATLGLALDLVDAAQADAAHADAGPAAGAREAAGLEPAQHLAWLERLEHRRFVVERLLEGWLPDDEAAADDAGRPSALREADRKRTLHLNRTLVPFERLHELRPDRASGLAQTAKDRRIAEIALEFAAAAPRPAGCTEAQRQRSA